MTETLALEFADVASGLRGWIGAGIPGAAEDETVVLLFEGAEVLAAERLSGASISESGKGARAELELSSGALDLRLTTAGRPDPLASGRATVEIARDGDRRSFECRGAILAPDDSPRDAELVRSMVAVQDDGAALALRSLLPAGSAGHGEERTSAWLLDPDETSPQPVGDPLLSTQYDQDGDQIRAGLELWVGDEDQVPLRAAGTRVAGTRLELDGWTLRAAFLAWTIEGTSGAGSYLIWSST